jgi:histone-lysine N-methyltransferase SETDB1
METTKVSLSLKKQKQKKHVFLHLDLNPLSIPMLCGWSREVAKQRHGERLSIIYRAPCGRRMRNMDEVHRYLRLTGSQIGVDLFCFDNFVHCFTEFEPEVVYSKINGMIIS